LQREFGGRRNSVCAILSAVSNILVLNNFFLDIIISIINNTQTPNVPDAMSTITWRSLRPILSHGNNSPSYLCNRPHLLTPSRPFSISQTRKAINPPASTLPPPLEVHIRAPGEGFVKFNFKRSKTYLQFYKTGAYAVFSNFTASQPLQKEIDTKFGLQKDSFSKAVNAGFIDRAQFQLLMRSWHDLWKLPAFGLMFIVIGEFTAAVVLLVPDITPVTCRIPQQVEKIRRNLEERRKKSFRDLTEELPALNAKYQDLNPTQLKHINASLGLSSSWWDYVGGVPGFLLNKRIRKKMEYLGHDDMLIEKEGGVSAIKHVKNEEVKLALVERGIDVMGVEPEQKLRRSLVSWFEARKVASIERLLLTR